MTDLSGKVAIVTGGSMGLGRAIAEAYLSAGANVVVMARHEPQEPLDKRILFWTGDVTDWMHVEGIVHRALNRFGKIDILVNCAAVHGPIGPLASLDLMQWSKACGVNLAGPALVMATVIPHLPAHGKIVNVAGGGATGPRPNFSAYAASKTALVRLTECVAAEYPHLDVNAMSPGKMPTRLLTEAGETGGDFAPAVALALWLAGAESDGITGRLFSALWDDYNLTTPTGIWPAALKPDDFTLRRVVPEWAKK